MPLEPPFSNYEHEIYAAGMLGGRKPTRPLDWRELERDAYAMLSRGPRGYIQGGAGAGETIRANREAFDEWRIVPRMLRDVSERSLERTVLGTRLPAPVLLAPIGVQTVAHPDGELASARAAAHVGVPLIASTAASHTIEQIAEAAGEQSCWYQLYWPRDRELARSFIERAEKSGYEAIVVTLDTWLLGWRPADLTDGFLPFLRGEGNANYMQDPVFRAALPKPPEEDLADRRGLLGVAVLQPLGDLGRPGFPARVHETADRLEGHPERRGRAARRGARHRGHHRLEPWRPPGRRGDRLPASAARRRGRRRGQVRDPLRQRYPLRRRRAQGLALGARAVCLGRPYVWGLALGGEQGVIDVLRAFLAELDLNMALSGHANIDEVAFAHARRSPAAGSR